MRPVPGVPEAIKGFGELRGRDLRWAAYTINPFRKGGATGDILPLEHLEPASIHAGIPPARTEYEVYPSSWMIETAQSASPCPPSARRI